MSTNNASSPKLTEGFDSSPLNNYHPTLRSDHSLSSNSFDASQASLRTSLYFQEELTQSERHLVALSKFGTQQCFITAQNQGQQSNMATLTPTLQTLVPLQQHALPRSSSEANDSFSNVKNALLSHQNQELFVGLNYQQQEKTSPTQWRSKVDTMARRRLVFVIQALLRHMRPDIEANSVLLKYMARFIEHHLYKTAPSREHHFDQSTLVARLKQLSASSDQMLRAVEGRRGPRDAQSRSISS